MNLDRGELLRAIPYLVVVVMGIGLLVVLNQHEGISYRLVFFAVIVLFNGANAARHLVRAYTGVDPAARGRSKPWSL